MRAKSGDKSGKGQKQIVNNIFGSEAIVNVRDIQKKLDKKKSDMGSSLTVTDADKESNAKNLQKKKKNKIAQLFITPEAPQNFVSNQILFKTPVNPADQNRKYRSKTQGDRNSYQAKLKVANALTTSLGQGIKTSETVNGQHSYQPQLQKMATSPGSPMDTYKRQLQDTGKRKQSQVSNGGNNQKIQSFRRNMRDDSSSNALVGRSFGQPQSSQLQTRQTFESAEFASTKFSNYQGVQGTNQVTSVESQQDYISYQQILNQPGLRSHIQTKDIKINTNQNQNSGGYPRQQQQYVIHPMKPNTIQPQFINSIAKQTAQNSLHVNPYSGQGTKSHQSNGNSNLTQQHQQAAVKLIEVDQIIKHIRIQQQQYQDQCMMIQKQQQILNGQKPAGRNQLDNQRMSQSMFPSNQASQKNLKKGGNGQVSRNYIIKNTRGSMQAASVNNDEFQMLAINLVNPQVIAANVNLACKYQGRSTTNPDGLTMAISPRSQEQDRAFKKKKPITQSQRHQSNLYGDSPQHSRENICAYLHVIPKTPNSEIDQEEFQINQFQSKLSNTGSPNKWTRDSDDKRKTLEAIDQENGVPLKTLIQYEPRVAKTKASRIAINHDGSGRRGPNIKVQGQPITSPTTAAEQDLRSSIDKNKEYQKHLEQYISPAAIIQQQAQNQQKLQQHQKSRRVMSNRKMGSDERVASAESPKVRATRTQSAVQPNKNKDEPKQTIFINHGDINININYPPGQQKTVGQGLDSKESHVAGKIDPEIEKFIVDNIQKQLFNKDGSPGKMFNKVAPQSQSYVSTHNSQISGKKEEDQLLSPNLKRNYAPIKKVSEWNDPIDAQNLQYFATRQLQNLQGSLARESSDIKKNCKLLSSQNPAISKSTLKKQVAQFCWQNLISSYNTDKIQLDVKGNSINNCVNGSQNSIYDPTTHMKQPTNINFGKKSSYNSKNATIGQNQINPTESKNNYNPNNDMIGKMHRDQRNAQMMYTRESQQQPKTAQGSRPSQIMDRQIQLNQQALDIISHHTSRNNSTMVDETYEHQTKSDERQHGLQMGQFNSVNQAGGNANFAVTNNQKVIPQKKLTAQNFIEANMAAHQQFLIQMQHYSISRQNIWQHSKYNNLINQYEKMENSYLQQFKHALDMYGNHSNTCKCHKILQMKQNIRQFIDPYDRLEYIQQVCTRERIGAAQNQNQVHVQFAKYTTQQKVIPSHIIKNGPKECKPTIVVSRMQQINTFIKKLNQLITITLKATDSINPLALGQIKKLGSELGIKWHNYMDAKFIKSKDFVIFLKSKIYVLFNYMLMKNNITLFQQVQQSKNPKEKDDIGKPSTPWNGNAITVMIGQVDNQISQQSSNYVNQNAQWLNQIQMYNNLQFKNKGFKYWVEYPSVWCNNFIVVRNTIRRRNWLTWVDHDPYEERDFQFEAQLIMNSLQAEKEKEEKEKEKQKEKDKEKEKENSPSKGSPDKNSKKKKAALEKEEKEKEKEEIQEVVKFKGPVLPNVIFTQIRRIKIIQNILPHQIYNHIDGINQIATKCQLTKNIFQYAREVSFEDPLEFMPETYIVEIPHIVTMKYLKAHEEFQAFQNACTKDSWWIVKPGEDANRGHGIKVLDNYQKICDYLTKEFQKGAKQYKTVIIQKYIEKPFLVFKRKFDIRVFALLTYVSNFEKQEGTLRGWFYEEGYVRTSCKEYTLEKGSDNPFVHLTNDAVQKQSQDYGKFESGNKISYSDFEKIIQKEKEISFYNKILPKIKKRVSDTFKSAGKKLIGEVRSDYNAFEWLGFDFMLDDDMNLTLIEVNTNPCLETQSCILLQRLIPQMLDQSMKIAIDPFFGANEQQYLMNHEFVATEIKYSMVFEETIENIRSTPFHPITELYYYSESVKMEEQLQDQNQNEMAEQQETVSQGSELEQETI